MSQFSFAPTIAVVLYPGCALFELAALLDGLHAKVGEHRATTVAARIRPLSGTSGVRLVAERTFEEVPGPSAVIVPGGGPATVAALADKELMAYVREAGAVARAVASIGCGSLVLSAAGLLAGRSATTAPGYAGVLAALGGSYADRPLVEDGPIVTITDVAALDQLTHALARRLEVLGDAS